MKGNRRRDTKPEVALRSALHATGLRFRRDFAVPLPGRRPVRVDIAFTRPKVAVFVDGCFWHRCPEHGTSPRSNSNYWLPKLERNAERDEEVDRVARRRIHLLGLGCLTVQRDRLRVAVERTQVPTSVPSTATEVEVRVSSGIAAFASALANQVAPWSPPTSSASHRRRNSRSTRS